MDPQKTKVILVGNSKFPSWGNENKDIGNAKANIEKLESIFKDDAYFGIKDENHLVVIKDETAQNVLLKVKKETKASKDKDKFERLIFYYVGHGIPGEDGKLFFATYDTIREDYELTSINSRLLFSYLKKFGTKELIIILDCCYAAQSFDNEGDADSLIEKCLPGEIIPNENPESNGVYYLFAAGKDNVAKFNPGESDKPTYFTQALLNSVEAGLGPGSDVIVMNELYKLICREINTLKKTVNPDIPDPRPSLEGNVGGFYFCKNKHHANAEDIDWSIVKTNPSNPVIKDFLTKYENSKYQDEADLLTLRIIEGFRKLQAALKNNNPREVLEIGKEYADIPEIKSKCRNFINDLRNESRENLRSESDSVPKSEDKVKSESPLAMATGTEDGLNRGESASARPSQGITENK